MTATLGTAKSKRSAERLIRCNGYPTGIGKPVMERVDLPIPKPRRPRALQAFGTSPDGPLTDVIQDGYIQPSQPDRSTTRSRRCAGWDCRRPAQPVLRRDRRMDQTTPDELIAARSQPPFPLGLGLRQSARQRRQTGSATCPRRLCSFHSHPRNRFTRMGLRSRTRFPHHEGQEGSGCRPAGGMFYARSRDWGARLLSDRFPMASNGSMPRSSAAVVTGIFPDGGPIVRLVGSILLEQNNNMTLETMADQAMITSPDCRP